MKKVVALALSSALLSGCLSSIVTEKDPELIQYDSQTDYKVSETDAGFDLYVLYFKPQSTLEYGEVDRGCRRQIAKIVEDYATEKGRPVQIIPRNAIVTDLDRYSDTHSRCRATANVLWK